MDIRWEHVLFCTNLASHGLLLLGRDREEGAMKANLPRVSGSPRIPIR